MKSRISQHWWYHRWELPALFRDATVSSVYKRPENFILEREMMGSLKLDKHVEVQILHETRVNKEDQ